jgi:hypothetical protein
LHEKLKGGRTDVAATISSWMPAGGAGTLVAGSIEFFTAAYQALRWRRHHPHIPALVFNVRFSADGHSRLFGDR